MKSWALITGASTGIGKELCYLFAKDNINLILCSRNEMKLSILAKELSENFSIEVFIFPCDLASENGAFNLVQFIQQKNLSLDFLVNNAGVGTHGAFHSIPWFEEQRMIQLNITSLTYLLKSFIPDMLKRKKGKILNVASTGAFQAGPKMSTYCATKAFVLSLGEALSEELTGSNVTLTTLCPGPTETDFFKTAKMTHHKLVSSESFIMMTPKEVAIVGYKAMCKSKPLVIAGLLNQLVAFSNRFVPRTVSTKIAHRLLK